MNTVTLKELVSHALANDSCSPGPNLTQLVNRACLVGWQFRMVFPTHAGEWSQVFDTPRKFRTGDPVAPHNDVHFEVRDVYAFEVEESATCTTTTSS